MRLLQLFFFARQADLGGVQLNRMTHKIFNYYASDENQSYIRKKYVNDLWKM